MLSCLLPSASVKNRCQEVSDAMGALDKWKLTSLKKIMVDKRQSVCLPVTLFGPSQDLDLISTGTGQPR